jgi:PPOX class probable F420-dependent enzyme
MTERWAADALPRAVIELIGAARIGRLATVNLRHEPRVVPICFALLETPSPLVVSVLDEKPKRLGDSELARVRNLRQNPACSLVIDHYEEDWTRLVFAQVNGAARVIEAGDHLHATALAALRDKYPQYRAMDLVHRPVIAIEIVAVTTWRGDGQLWQ